MPQSTTPHDALFKQFLGHPETARIFLEFHLPDIWRARCDLTTLRLESSSFIEADLRGACSDILYSLQTTKGKGYVYCLVEHQSTPDPLMAFRLMRYSILAMQAHLDKSKAKRSAQKLPLVIPILFYHGQVRPYPHSTCWLDNFADPEAARMLYSQPFPLVDVTAIPDDEILRHKQIALLELVQKHIWQRDVAELLEPVGYLLRIVGATAEQQEALLNYLLQAGNMADTEKFKDRLIHLSPEHKEKMMTIAEQLKRIGREEGWEKGLEKGLEEGLEKGREEGWEKGREDGAVAERLSLARNLLKMNFPVEKIAEATGLSVEEIQSLRPH